MIALTPFAITIWRYIWTREMTNTVGKEVSFFNTVAGDSISALIDFNKAVEIDPLNYLNFQQRGVFYLEHGHYETALDDHNAAIRLNSENAMNFNNKAVTLFFLGRYEEALENFNIALRLDNTGP